MNLGLANWKKNTNIPGSFTGITAWLISTNVPSPPGSLPLPKSCKVKGCHSALWSAGLDIWTPELLTPFHQVWSDGKSTCVRRSSPLQASRAGFQVSPWDLGTSGVSPSITLDWPATFSATMRSNISWPSVTWDWSHDFLLLWISSTGIHLDL